jgi:hypothetical protein
MYRRRADVVLARQTLIDCRSQRGQERVIGTNGTTVRHTTEKDTNPLLSVSWRQAREQHPSIRLLMLDT